MKIKEIIIVGTEESGAIIKPNEKEGWDVYEIPEYGGEPIHNGAYLELENAINYIKKWT